MVFVIFSVVLYLSLSSRVSLSLSSVDDSLPPSPLVLSLSFPLFARTCVHFSIPKHRCFQVENWKFKEFGLSFNRESQTFVVSQLPPPAEVISVVVINNNKDQSIINVANPPLVGTLWYRFPLPCHPPATWYHVAIIRCIVHCSQVQPNIQPWFLLFILGWVRVSLIHHNLPNYQVVMQRPLSSPPSIASRGWKASTSGAS